MTVFMMLIGAAAWGQHEGGKHAADHGSQEVEALLDVFEGAELEGHIRNYFMSTINAGEAQDYYTNATGGAIGIETRPLKGFSAGVKGIFTYQTFSSDLNHADSVTNAVSKWEHELYDINDLENFHDLDRLEELYVAYHAPKFSALMGKIPMQETNLVNKSDGRMKPFAYSGALFNWFPDSSLHVFAAGINRVSPRSTVEWYDFNEAIGIVTNGVQPDGSEAEYEGQSESRGMLIAGVDKTWANANGNTSHAFSLYNYHIDRVLNTSFVEWTEKRGDWDVTLQYAYQLPDARQAELEYIHRYVQPDEHGQVASGALGRTWGNWRGAVAFSHVFSTGRFLFPRELGRDHFTTSISRSRLEGLGEADVVTLHGHYAVRPHFNLELQWTLVQQHAEEAHAMNKYDFEDYHQVNVRWTHALQGPCEGLEWAVLYVYKQNLEAAAPVAVFNRSNFHQINVVANLNF